MKTLLEILDLTSHYLKEKGIDKSRREAEWLISDCLGVKRIELFLQHERPLLEEELKKCREAMVRRAKGEPAAYISGKVFFAGITVKVTPDVLIPRPETEILFEKICSTLSKEDLQGKTLWDVCTGSGYLGIAIKKRFPELQVVLSDLSEKALAIAKENATQNGVEVELLQGDMFAPFVGRTCDFFVCNPPYISEGEYGDLHREVRDFEPKLALVGGKTGLEFYQRIAVELRQYLNGKGWLEIGTGQGEKVLTIFREGKWKNCSYEKDWSGHDRYFFIEDVSRET